MFALAASVQELVLLLQKHLKIVRSKLLSIIWTFSSTVPSLRNCSPYTLSLLRLRRRVQFQVPAVVGVIAPPAIVLLVPVVVP